MPAWNGWGDKRKLKALREIATAYGRDPHLRDFVIQTVIRGVPNRDYPGQARAILAWIQQNIRYVNETNEQLQSPAYTLRVRHGDCDDLATLMGAFATSIALPWRFALAGKDGAGRPYRWLEGAKGGRPPWRAKFFHIYCQLGWPPFNPRVWASAEPTMQGAPLGFDVVAHGHGRDRHGAPTLPELAGYGAPDVAASSGEHSDVMTRILHAIPWKTLALGITQGVISMIVVRMLLARYERTHGGKRR